MDILILGGTGFISGHLTQRLLDAGHHVTILTRGSSRRSFERADRLERLRADRNDRSSLTKALGDRRFDAVYDMIAYLPEQSRLAVEVMRGRTERFIHCSTVSVYMVSDLVTCPVTEDQDALPLMPYWPRNPFGMDYGINKRRCEDVLWAAHDPEAFPVTMVRPTYVCGPEDPTLRDFFWIQRILDGGPLLVPGSGDHAFQLIYVEDAARIFADLLDAPETIGRAYNAAGEDILTLKDYLRRTAALLNREVELVQVDQDVFDALPFSTHPRGDVFPFNTRRTSIFSLDRVKRDVRFSSTPFDTWMEVTLDWYCDVFQGASIGYDRRAEELAFASEVQKARLTFRSRLTAHLGR